MRRREATTKGWRAEVWLEGRAGQAGRGRGGEGALIGRGAELRVSGCMGQWRASGSGWTRKAVVGDLMAGWLN